MYRKSRYTFLINVNQDYLVYNSAKNNFWEINKYVYDLIQGIQVDDIEKILDEDVKGQVRQLHAAGIVTNEEEDESVVNNIRIVNMISACSSETLSITLLPTLSCNLVCPYCFETKKHKGFMSEETCDKVLEFLKSHELARNLSLTWFGGEPMLGYKVMEYFLSHLNELENIKLAYHSIITNGTLLTQSRWKIFEDYPLNAVQITFDGVRDTHDKRRIYPDGRGTYDEILNNVLAFADAFPKTHISIRVNIDKNNADEFMNVYDDIKSVSSGKNISVYPGIITGCGQQDIDSPLLMNADLIKIKSEYVKRGYPIDYPARLFHGCCATRLSCYVIGPKGEIYKCWMDVGKENKVVGDVFQKKFTNQRLVEDYFLKGSHVQNPDCWPCPFLPICSKDCANERMDNLKNDAGHDLCSIYKENNNEYLVDTLYQYYISKKAGSHD